MTISYRHNIPLTTQDIIRVFDSSGIVRPTHDTERIARMFAEANLVVSAWADDVLVGVARALTDFRYCCYLSDLAVAKDFQKQGIGTRLIEEVRNALGDEVSLILISNDNALTYYPKVGFAKTESAYVIKRKK